MICADAILMAFAEAVSKSGKEEVSSESVLAGCQTRSKKRVKKAGQVRVSRKRVKSECVLQERQIRESHRSFKGECPHKTVQKARHLKVSSKSPPQKCQVRVSYEMSRKPVKSECPAKVSYKSVK